MHRCKENGNCKDLLWCCLMTSQNIFHPIFLYWLIIWYLILMITTDSLIQIWDITDWQVALKQLKRINLFRWLDLWRCTTHQNARTDGPEPAPACSLLCSRRPCHSKDAWWCIFFVPSVSLTSPVTFYTISLLNVNHTHTANGSISVTSRTEPNLSVSLKTGDGNHLEKPFKYDEMFYNPVIIILDLCNKSVANTMEGLL